MTKAILMSIRPQHAVNILNGDKTLDIRKRVPKDFKGWVYIYCTKGKPYIRELGDNYFTECSKVDVYKLNGKVVARFWFDEYTYIFDYRKIDNWDFSKPYYVYNSLLTFRVMELKNKLCLTEEEINNYGKGKDLYAWHIKRLEIFDQPKELNEFYKEQKRGQVFTMTIQNNKYIPIELLTKAPQSYQYVYVNE